MEQKGKGYQGIIATEAFEYKNVRSDFKYCYAITDKNEKLCQHNPIPSLFLVPE